MQLFRNAWVYLGALLTIAWSACDNTLQITTAYEEKTYVYGLLDFGDSVHYVRVQKSFLSEDSSPYLLLSDPYQSNYLENELEVWMEGWKAGMLIQTCPMEYTLGDSIGLEKEEGLFPTSPNVLFRYTGSIDSTADYRLFVYRKQLGDTLTATTDLVHSFKVLFPVPSIYGINFTDTNKIQYANTYAVNARIYDMIMRLHYSETNLATGIQEKRYVDWIMFDNILGENDYGSGIVGYEMRANFFFTFVSSVLFPNPGLYREFEMLSYRFYAGGEDLYLLYLNNIANLGFGELYASTVYTNVQGGYGIFSSRKLIEVDSVLLSNLSLDSLACGSLTGDLGFLPSLSNPDYPNCN